MNVLKYPLLWAAGRWTIFFLFDKSKSCMKTYVDFKLEKKSVVRTIKYEQNLWFCYQAP